MSEPEPIVEPEPPLVAALFDLLVDLHAQLGRIVGDELELDGVLRSPA